MTDPLHPSQLLNYLVHVALPAKCHGNDRAQKYFAEALKVPATTIAECSRLVQPWLNQLYAQKQLLDTSSYEDKLSRKEQLTMSPGIYVLCLRIDNDRFFYVGQSVNVRRRLQSHFNETYREKNHSLLYYMWNFADKIDTLLVVDDQQQALAQGGPTIDILEHWMALVFRALQPPDLESSISAEAWKHLGEKDFSHGLNVREPLAQVFRPNEWPIRGAAFLKTSPVPEFQQYFQERKERKEKISLQFIRRRLLIEGDIYRRAVWPRNGFKCTKFPEFMVFRLMNILVRIECATYARWKPDTMRVQLDLVQKGKTHPHTIIRGKMSPARYEDPARRLGIKVSGVLHGSCWETREPESSVVHEAEVTTYFWASQDGGSNAWVARWNKIVDWLERENERTIRPRRCYSRDMLTQRDQYYGWRGNDLYTLHPKDTPDWMVLHTFEEYCAFNDEGKKKPDPTIPLPTSMRLLAWRRHWHREHPPPTTDEEKEIAREAAEQAAALALATVRVALEEGEEEYEESSTQNAEALMYTDSDMEEIYDSEGEEPDTWPWS